MQSKLEIVFLQALTLRRVVFIQFHWVTIPPC